MKLLILGVCGTFMGGIAAIARGLGHQVVGIDEQVYPPMSTQLQAIGVELIQGYGQISNCAVPDLVIIGNVMSRGNPAVEYVLNQGWAYCSGPQWMAEHGLKGKQVIAVAGTHGKTTTSSMVTWILEAAGFNPSYLIGGVPGNFKRSARLTDSKHFVIEADEYDSAFFDKRSKFIHYHPDTLIINNLEYDHADIFDSIDDIYKQFAYLLRTVPGNGCVITPADDDHVAKVMARGCWSDVVTFGLNQGDWHAKLLSADGSSFEVYHHGKLIGEVTWSLLGKHNVANAVVAIAASVREGVEATVAINALAKFVNAKRRLEKIADVAGVSVYDDFAHHPTAIQSTIDGLKHAVGNQRILAIVEMASYTMREGHHEQSFMKALEADAAHVFLLKPAQCAWDFEGMCKQANVPVSYADEVSALVAKLCDVVQPGDNVLIMSNRGFGGIQKLLPKAIEQVLGC